MDCPTITSGETCGGCRLAKKTCQKKREKLSTEDFGEKFNQKYQNILKKPKKEKQSWSQMDRKLHLYVRSHLLHERFVDFKVYLMIWKEK